MATVLDLDDNACIMATAPSNEATNNLARAFATQFGKDRLLHMVSSNREIVPTDMDHITVHSMFANPPPGLSPELLELKEQHQKIPMDVGQVEYSTDGAE